MKEVFYIIVHKFSNWIEHQTTSFRKMIFSRTLQTFRNLNKMNPNTMKLLLSAVHCSQVLIQIGIFAESLFADLTAVRFEAEMNGRHVRLKV